MTYTIQAHIANWGKNRNLKPGLSAPEFGVHRNKMLSAEVTWGREVRSGRRTCLRSLGVTANRSLEA